MKNPLRIAVNAWVAAPFFLCALWIEFVLTVAYVMGYKGEPQK